MSTDSEGRVVLGVEVLMRSDPGSPEGFAEFVAERSDSLVRAAWLLTGDAHKAEDLVQVALVRLWERWSKVDEPGAYARRVLYTTYMTWWRRRWRAETPSAAVPDTVTRDDVAGDAVVRLAVRGRLARLSSRQRAVVVLRFFEDCSVEEAARVLGCSTGSVKTHTSRALAALREDTVLKALMDEGVVL
ncbi:SigE family RNA polymerase sigma factor [Actinosynnema sp. CA-299493]